MCGWGIGRWVGGGDGWVGGQGGRWVGWVGGWGNRLAGICGTFRAKVFSRTLKKCERIVQVNLVRE